MIKKAVALTLREYWRAVHGTEPEKEFPCEYPGFVPDCENSSFAPMFCRQHKSGFKWFSCWNTVIKVNGKYPIRRVGYKGGRGR